MCHALLCAHTRNVSCFQFVSRNLFEPHFPAVIPVSGLKIDKWTPPTGLNLSRIGAVCHDHVPSVDNGDCDPGLFWCKSLPTTPHKRSLTIHTRTHSYEHTRCSHSSSRESCCYMCVVPSKPFSPTTIINFSITLSCVLLMKQRSQQQKQQKQSNNITNTHRSEIILHIQRRSHSNSHIPPPKYTSSHTITHTLGFEQTRSKAIERQENLERENGN